MMFATVKPCSINCMICCVGALLFLWCILASVSSFVPCMHACHSCALLGFLAVFHVTSRIKLSVLILKCKLAGVKTEDPFYGI